jgi:23S rRNA (uracil1939-C5)-methyltransferase
LSTHYTTGDVIDVHIEKIVPRGFGLGFAENLTLLVPLAAPGDDLRVKIIEIKKRMAFAEIVQVQHPGPSRIAPPCPYFGVCGGCDLQQLSYDAQLAAKSGIVRDCLSRIGKIEVEGDITIIPSPNEFHYRSRARWHVDREAKKIGYFARDSHNVVDIGECAVLTPGMQSTLEYARESVNWESFWSETGEIEAASGEGGRISMYSADMAEPTAEISIEIGGETYAYSAQSFFQANRFLIETLIKTAIGDAAGALAVDLYSGVGLFTLPLARRFEKVIAVEEDGVAADLAAKNVETAGLTNVKVVTRGVGKYLVDKKFRRPDLILIDPPRSGAERGTIEKVAETKARLIVTALDLFPQTHHVETVVRLTRVEAVGQE